MIRKENFKILFLIMKINLNKKPKANLYKQKVLGFLIYFRSTILTFYRQ